MKRRLFNILFAMVLVSMFLALAGCKSKTEADEEPVIPSKEQMSEIGGVDEPEDAEIIINAPSEEPVPEEVHSETENVPVEDCSEDPVYELCQVVHCNEYITLRTQPATTGAEICKIPLGANVYYLGYGDNGFVKVEYDGQEGYALASYLNFTKEDGAIFMKVYNCNESITLRKIPSTDAEEFCQIPLGEKVIFREAAQNGFYMVSYNGYTGYALEEYLIEW